MYFTVSSTYIGSGFSSHISSQKFWFIQSKGEIQFDLNKTYLDIFMIWIGSESTQNHWISFVSWYLRKSLPWHYQRGPDLCQSITFFALFAMHLYILKYQRWTTPKHNGFQYVHISPYISLLSRKQKRDDGYQMDN